jgi:hypothetical protein
MRISLRSRHALAIGSCAALAAGLAAVPVGPASAAPSIQVYVVQGNSNADSACSVTSGSADTPFTQKPLIHGRRHGAVNLLTTWTNDGDPSDVTSVTGHYSGSTHLVKHNGAFSSATLTGSGHIDITRALGSASSCEVGARLLNAVEFVTKQPAGWYYVTRSTVKNSLTETIVAPGSGSSVATPVLFEAYQGGKGTVTQRAFVSKGKYVTALVAGIEAGKFPLITTKAANVNTMSAVFRNAGSALSATSGSAGKFVKFPASVSCSHHSAKLTWTGKAGQVAGGSFFVNGHKKASVSNPKAGHSVVLHHLGKSADNKITAKLSLTSGGKTSASRLYVPCKG